MVGVFANVATVIIGTVIGILIKKGLPKKIASAMTTATALAVMYIGINGMMSGEKTLVLVLSMVMGGVLGTALNLDGRISKLGKRIENKFRKNGSQTLIAEGFVSATLLFCVGAMTVVGSLQAGISGNNETLFTKAILDFVSSIVLASTLGVGVILASVSVLVLQGSIVLLAQFAAPFLSNAVVAEMTCVGSVLIFALALNMLDITRIKLMNFVPAIFVPILLCTFM